MAVRRLGLQSVNRYTAGTVNGPPESIVPVQCCRILLRRNGQVIAVFYGFLCTVSFDFNEFRPAAYSRPMKLFIEIRYLDCDCGPALAGGVAGPKGRRAL